MQKGNRDGRTQMHRPAAGTEGQREGKGARGKGKGAPGGANGARARLTGLAELFPDNVLAGDDYELLHRALQAVLPLKRAHREELPRNIVALSRLLTVDRAGLRRPYWASPALTGAYMHYFLPWNVFRLSRLFAGLDLPAPTEANAFLLDLGSGPLTLPLSLWLADKKLRAHPLRVLATDCAGHPLHLGRALLEEMARLYGVAPWSISVVQAPVLQGVREGRELVRKGGVPWLVSAANVLNELPFPRRTRFEDGEDGEDEENLTRFEELARVVAQLLRKGNAASRALLVEPGTRLGGLALMRMRGFLAEEGLEIEAPCPHTGPCPLLGDEDDDVSGEEREASRPAGRTWCHAVFSGKSAPSWLAELSQAAGFAKERLSLAFLEARVTEQSGEEKQSSREEKRVRARVVSGPFAVPGLGPACRYACSDRGLLLVQNAGALASGSFAEFALDNFAGARRDRRSGARVVALEEMGTAGVVPLRRGVRGEDRKGTAHRTQGAGRQGTSAGQEQDRKEGLGRQKFSRREEQRPRAHAGSVLAPEETGRRPGSETASSRGQRNRMKGGDGAR